MSSDVIRLDRALAVYGSDADAVRIQVRDALEAAANRVWPSTSSTRVTLHPVDTMDRVEAQLNALAPKTSNQAYAKTHSIALLNSLQQSNWQLFVQ